MAKRTLVAAAVVAGLMALGFAADIQGRWQGTLPTPQGDVQLTYTFKVDADTLTGGVESPMNQFPISNGKISGDEFSFDVDTGTDYVSHQGRITGDTIHMRSQGPWGEMEMVLKRVAESN